MIKKILFSIVWLCFCVVSDISAIQVLHTDFDAYKKLDRMTYDQLNVLGKDYLKNGVYDTALICFNLLCDRYKPDEMSDKQKKEFADICNLTGTLYYNCSNYNKAMSFFIKGLKVCEDVGSEFTYAHINSNIGNVYLAYKEYDKAISYFKLSYNRSKKYGFNDLMYTAINNLIIANCYIGKIDSVKFYMNKISVNDRGIDIELRQSLFNSQGVVNMNFGILDSALFYFKRAYIKDSGSYKQNSVALSNMGSAFKELKCYDSAVYYLNLSNVSAEKYDFLNLLSLNYSQLSKIYESMGDYKKSLFYNRKYQLIRDSVFDTHEYGEVKDKQFVYEMDKIEKELELLNAEKEIQRMKINGQKRILQIVSASFCLILILLIVLYLQKRKLGKSYKSIFEKNVDFINSEKYNRELRNDYDRKLKSMEHELVQLRGYGSLVGNDASESETAKSLQNDFKMEWLIDAIKNVMDNSTLFCNVDFTLESLAELVNSNTKYVSIVINNVFGKNFNTFVNEYRVKKACTLLISEDSKRYTIETIAEMVGFKSKSSFNPIFKKLTGLTPSQYQKMSIDSLI